MRFHNVAVLMGGPSAEREVSLRSGAAVAEGLRTAGYAVTPVDVAGREVTLPPGVEAAFLALHGEFGEDGAIQAILDERGIPYTGSGAQASRTAFDKLATKRLLGACGVPTPDYEVAQPGRGPGLALPLVVKPVRQGSSLGLHRVFTAAEWAPAVADAARYDGTVMAEAYIAGRELTVGLVGGDPLPVLEIVAPEGWYDYHAKYTRGVCRYEVPARLEPATAERCQALALRTFDALGCRGLARVDFRLSPQGELFVLELNSLPGFTETSLLPKAAACAGLNFSQLCDRVMSLARAG